MTRPLSPSDDLFIYEISGVIPLDSEPDLGLAFLGFWVEDHYTFFFFQDQADREMSVFLSTSPHLALRCLHRMKYGEWQDGAGFAPIRVGPLSIVPAWTTPAGSKTPSDIVIDPGLAFGFGGHPTTRACLAGLVRIFSQDRPEAVLDLGTGTGILALAAARLGASKVRAVEYSNLAADAARKNTERNGMTGVVEVVRGLAEDHLDFPADLVVSNLHFQVQKSVLEAGGFFGRKWLVLSGLFHSEGDSMEGLLAGAPLDLVDRVRDDRWVTLVYRSIRNT